MAVYGDVALLVRFQLLFEQLGVWFDADELPRIIGFIRDGGMSIARQREKRDIEEQREKLRDESRANRLHARRFGPDRTYSDDETGVNGFLRKLFE